MSRDELSISDLVEISGSQDAEVARVLDAYLADLEAGRAADPERLLAEHPKIASQLRVCLEVMHLAGRVADVSGTALVGDDGARPAPQLDDYRIVRQVGRGGMGIVYEAEQQSLRRRVALKVLPLAAAIDPRQLRRFHVEAQAAAQLHHTNIVPVYAVGCERGVHYYAMQYIEGKSLAELIRELRQLEGRDAVEEAPTAVPGDDQNLAGMVASGQLAPAIRDDPPRPIGERVAEGRVRGSSSPAGGPLIRPAGTFSPGGEGDNRHPPDSTQTSAYFRTVANLGIQAAEALEHAHQEGVVHRDIKPANLMVDAKGHLWITDFGLARLQNDSGLTLSGDLVGTIRYMSPEQAIGHRAVVDQRTDVYSLGVTIYEILALEPAFDGRDRRAVLRRIIEDDPRPLRVINSAVPRGLETIVQKATAKEPGSRYLTAHALADDLRRFLEHKPILARRPSLVERAGKWARRHIAVVAAAFAVLTIAVGALASSTVLIARAQRRTAAALKTAENSSRQARRAVDTMYTRVAEQWLAQKADLEPIQRVFLQEALDFYRLLVRDESPSNDPAVRRETARAYDRVAELERRLGRVRDAEAAFRSAIAIQDALVASHPDPDNRVEAALTRKRLGNLLVLLGRTAEAEEILRHARSSLETLSADQPARRDIRNELAAAILALARLWGSTGRAEDAASAFRQASELFQAVVDQDPRDHRGQNGLASCQSGLGLASFLRGEYPGAQSALERAILHRQAAIAVRPRDEAAREALAYDYSTLGEVLDFMGHPQPAEGALKQAAKLHGELLREFPNVPEYAAKKADDEFKIGFLYALISRYRDAEEVIQRALAEYSALCRRFPDRVDYRLREASVRGNFANILTDMGRSEEAERQARAAVGLYEQTLKTMPDFQRARTGLATTLHILGNLLGNLQRLEPQDSPADRGRLAEARRCLEQAIELARAALKISPGDQLNDLARSGDTQAHATSAFA